MAKTLCSICQVPTREPVADVTFTLQALGRTGQWAHVSCLTKERERQETRASKTGTLRLFNKRIKR